MSGDSREIDVAIWRGDAGGSLQSYAVPWREGETVLDLVTHVQRRLDPTLAYRFACRVGMCGSCAMTVNGRPRWTCRTLVRDALRHGRLELRPLANLPVIRDLVADMTPFFEKWQRAHGRFRPSDEAAPMAAIVPDSDERQAIDAAIECINCGVCHAACDVVATLPDYLGPAPLSRAWSLMRDSRDGGGDERLRAVAAEGGCHSCHTRRRCAEVCPKQLNPTASIAGLKRLAATAALRGKL